MQIFKWRRSERGCEHRRIFFSVHVMFCTQKSWEQVEQSSDAEFEARIANNSRPCGSHSTVRSMQIELISWLGKHF